MKKKSMNNLCIVNIFYQVDCKYLLHMTIECNLMFLLGVVRKGDRSIVSIVTALKANAKTYYVYEAVIPVFNQENKYSNKCIYKANNYICMNCLSKKQNNKT